MIYIYIVFDSVIFFCKLEQMDPLGKPTEENNIGSPDDTLALVKPVVEYEIRDPIPGLGQYDSVNEYFWMQ